MTIDTDTGSGDVEVTVERDHGRHEPEPEYEELFKTTVDPSDSEALDSVPDKLRLSITGSTGGATNYHELSSVRVAAENCATVDDPVVTSESLSVIEGATEVG
ncbi:MAG: hypothetical protein R6V10_13870, partial [bacterium]